MKNRFLSPSVPKLIIFFILLMVVEWGATASWGFTRQGLGQIFGQIPNPPLYELVNRLPGTNLILGITILLMLPLGPFIWLIDAVVLGVFRIAETNPYEHYSHYLVIAPYLYFLAASVIWCIGKIREKFSGVGNSAV